MSRESPAGVTAGRGFSASRSPAPIFLTEEQQKRLDRRAKEEGVTKSGLIRAILDEALAISRSSTTPRQAIEGSSGIWADRDLAELDEVLRWRQEPPLQRLGR